LEKTWKGNEKKQGGQPMGNEGYEPKLVGFLCNWCSYTGADLAGTARMMYAPNMRIIRVMCSGRVDPQFVLKAFKEGADGVLISGCHPGDCHYQEGNYKALRRHRLLSKMLEQLGIEKERFRLEWVSAAEGAKFQKVCDEFTEEIKKMGPLTLNGGMNEQREA
jgi:F420-non-reducing hydrogenase iron-sulfur subunit